MNIIGIPRTTPEAGRGGSINEAFRWAEAEKALSGSFAPSALAGIKPDGSNMISDLHGTGAYRAHLAAVLTGRAVAAA